MHKLRLDIDALAVESYATDDHARWADVGTVKAHQDAADAADDAADDARRAATNPSECPTCDTCQGPNCRDGAEA